MNFDLPPTGMEQPPAFTSAEACRDWLASVPLANAVQAQSMLLRQLSLLHRYTLAPAARFAILEALRVALYDVQDDAAKKFAGKPVPLAPHEQAALGSTLNVWQELALGYLRCFDEVCGGVAKATRAELENRREHCSSNPEIASLAALAAQRATAVFADWQVDLARGSQVPDPVYWRKLHLLLLATEILGIANKSVDDKLQHGASHTCVLAAYAECCLLATATIYELPPRHLNWVARWARRWGSKLSLLHAAPEDLRQRAVPLWIDLGSDRSPSYLPRETDNGRWLETTDLRRSLVARITLLEQGRAPGELQLGDDVTQPAATLLLQRVLQRWCKGGATRRQERHSANEPCTVIPGLDNAHFEISGRVAFRAPSRSDSALRKEREEMETYGNHGERRASADDQTEHIEQWNVLDESTSGLRVRRPLKHGARIGPGQVVAVKIASGQYYIIGNVRWVLREDDENLVAGLQLFPGEPRPGAVRVIDGTGKTPWAQCVLLPAIPAIKESATLILPAGTFRLDREIEVQALEKVEKRKLFRVLDRGIEFERCNCYD